MTKEFIRHQFIIPSVTCGDGTVPYNSKKPGLLLRPTPFGL